MSEPEIIDVPRDTPQCQEGQQAHADGQTQHECPYPIGDNQRTGWLTGWYDALVRERFGAVFERCGVTYP